MKSLFSRALFSSLGTVGVVMLLTATACGSATPTRPAATATLIAAAPATSTPAVAATPTLTTTVAATSTVAITTTVPATGTKVAQFVTPTKAVAKPTNTKGAAPPPAPGALTGHVAFSVRLPWVDLTRGEAFTRQIWVMNADGSGAHQILERARWPAFSPDGTRMAYFELDTGLHLADANGGGGKVAVSGGGICCYSWSPDGQWIAYTDSINSNKPTGPLKKVKVDTAFNYGNQNIIDLGVKGLAPAFSPDGKQIAFGGCLTNSSTCGIFVISADGGTPRVLTQDYGGNPHWSPKGDKIVYHAGVANEGRNQVFVVDADGKNKKQLTTSTRGNDGQPIFSRDGTRIFYRSDQDGTEWAIYVMNADGSGKKKLYGPVPADQDFWGWDSLSVSP